MRQNLVRKNRCVICNVHRLYCHRRYFRYQDASEGIRNRGVNTDEIEDHLFLGQTLDLERKIALPFFKVETIVYP